MAYPEYSLRSQGRLSLANAYRDAGFRTTQMAKAEQSTCLKIIEFSGILVCKLFAMKG